MTAAPLFVDQTNLRLLLLLMIGLSTSASFEFEKAGKVLRCFLLCAQQFQHF